MAPQLRAGVARAVITPPVGITHANWGAQTHRRAEGIDLDLWATALVLAEGETQVAIVDADLLGFPNNLVPKIRAAVTDLTGIPGEHVRLASSHTHSGGNLAPAWYPDGAEMIPGFHTSLIDKIAGAVWEAQRALRPARLAAGIGHSEVAMDRRLWHREQGRIVLGRNRDGSTDHTLPVARIDDEQERPIAILVNYACHPTIMAHGNSLITPDYPGALRRTVEANLDGLCLFLHGASGDQHSRESFTSSRAGYRHAGKLIGLEAAKVAEGLETLPKVERLVEVLESGAELGIYEEQPGPEPDGALRVATRTIALPLADLPSVGDAESAYTRATAAVDEAGRSGDAAAIRKAGYRAKRAGMLLDMSRTYADQASATVTLQAMRIGGLGLLALAGEPFAEIGVRVKAGSPFPVTMFSGYSNGIFAYIPMASDHEEGGYGVWNSPLGPGAADIVVEESIALLRELV